MKTKILADFQTCTGIPLRKIQTSRLSNSKIPKVKNGIFSVLFLYGAKHILKFSNLHQSTFKNTFKNISGKLLL